MQFLSSLRDTRCPSVREPAVRRHGAVIMGARKDFCGHAPVRAVGQAAHDRPSCNFDWSLANLGWLYAPLRMHTWRTAFELRAFTTKTIADWIGHQGAFRAYFAQVSVRYLTLHPTGMRDLHFLCLCHRSCLVCLGIINSRRSKRRNGEGEASCILRISQ